MFNPCSSMTLGQAVMALSTGSNKAKFIFVCVSFKTERRDFQHKVKENQFMKISFANLWDVICTPIFMSIKILDAELIWFGKKAI